MDPASATSLFSRVTRLEKGTGITSISAFTFHPPQEEAPTSTASLHSRFTWGFRCPSIRPHFTWGPWCPETAASIIAFTFHLGLPVPGPGPQHQQHHGIHVSLAELGALGARGPAQHQQHHCVHVSDVSLGPLGLLVPGERPSISIIASTFHLGLLVPERGPSISSIITFTFHRLCPVKDPSISAAPLPTSATSRRLRLFGVSGAWRDEPKHYVSHFRAKYSCRIIIESGLLGAWRQAPALPASLPSRFI